MSDTIWKIISIIFIGLWCVLGVHLIITSFNEESYWECSVYVVTEYLLLNLFKDVISMKLDENEDKKDKINKIRKDYKQHS